jgi:hypothetical protein
VRRPPGGVHRPPAPATEPTSSAAARNIGRANKSRPWNEKIPRWGLEVAPEQDADHRRVLAVITFLEAR